METVLSVLITALYLLIGSGCAGWLIAYVRQGEPRDGALIGVFGTLLWPLVPLWPDLWNRQNNTVKVDDKKHNAPPLSEP